MVKLQIFVYLLFLSFDTLRGINGDDHAVRFDLDDDILGLIVFKSDLQNPPALTSWTEDDSSACNWKYILCNPVTGRVSGLSLTGLGLSGRLGRGLEKLQGLRILSLSHNNLTGEISPVLAQLPNLVTLDLSYNKFSGHVLNTFSQMGFSPLRYLDISHNLLSGPLHDDIFMKFQSLRFLSLSGNTLEGPIPSTLFKCSALSGLNLSNNHFSGNPFGNNNGIWSLNRLRLLDLSNNFLSGNIPKGIYILHSLKELYLQGNQLSGFIPSDIGLCPHLIKVDLSNNLFIGEIPSSFSRLKSLISLGLANNMLSGEFPQWIGSLTTLQNLDLSNNGLTGFLPSSMVNLISLQVLSLSNNKLSGNLPNSIVYCTRMRTLQLSGNLLNGSIPEGLFSMGLEELDLSGNSLSGPIPPGSGRLFESLLVLDLSKNDLTGEIPPEMGLFSGLRYLNLSWNYNLHSRIPPEIGYLQNLTVLDLRDTALYGMIPGDLCQSSSSLLILQLDDNSLTGPIPDEIGNCSSLYLLSLSHNKLSGPIPSSMSMLKRLEILRLESNELSGEMPRELGTLQNLLAVNISYNKLIGRLPPGGIFPRLDASALQGNLGLCSPLLKGPCKLDVQKPLVLDPNAYPKQTHGENSGNELTTRSAHHRFFSISAIVAISAGVIIIAGVVVITLLNASARRKLAFIDNALESIFSSSSRSATPSIGRLVLFDSRSSGNLFVDPESLINKSSQIGEGFFGTVFKASLGEEGKILAVKKLITTNILQHPEDFDRDFRALGKVKHPNLIPLRGYYWTPQLQLLVSDYATNGSLQFRLHEGPPNMVPLSWATRYKILLGTAKGLAHLHHSCNPPITHYNMKPSNILLDENYNAKISDFGLAALLTKLDKHPISSRFQGAPGYAAPELACQSLRINEKCDVYGFGVIVLELVTGRRPIEYGDDNVVMLNDHVRVLLEQGDVLDCVDQSMGEYPDEEVLPVLKVALVCTSQIPSSRPSMAEVVQILQVIKTPAPQRLEAY